MPRTKEQAGALSEQLRGYGAVPVEVPTIAVEPPRSPAPMDRGIKGLFAGRYQWAVFTSANAVRAVVEKFADWGLDARAFAGVKIAAVGEQTAAALVAFGIRPDLVPSGEQSSEGLLADFPPYDDVLDPIDRVFLPRADIATETLVAGLNERGWEVDDVTAYRTVRAAPPPAETRDAIKSGGFDAVLFTSSSTVRNLVGIAGKPHPSTVIAVIGPQTAKTAEELGLRVDVRAPTASAAALAQALADWAVAQREAAATPAKTRRACPAERARRGRARADQNAPPVARTRGRRPHDAHVGHAADAIDDAQASAMTGEPAGFFPATRMRRLRRTAALRRLVAEVRLHPADLLLPLFVKEGIAEPAPIASMPGVVQHTRDSLRKAAHEAVEAGVGGLILFGVPATKDARGSAADDPDGVVQLALRDLAADLGDATVLIADLCLDEYTDHGHCGVLTDAGEVDNDATLERYAAIAVAQAAAGRARRRAERHDGRSGRRDPRRARRRRSQRRRDPRVRREVRLGVLRAVPRRGRVRAAVR